MPQIKLNLSKGIFNDVYYPYLFDYENRYEVYFGSAGSGKSHFVFQKIIIKALNNRRKVLVVRKVARTLKDSCFQMCLDTLDKFKLLDKCVINRTTFTITLPNGSLLLFTGMDNSEKIKSIAGITDIVIEEATEITPDDFTQLDLRLRAAVKNLQMYLMFNPVSKANWVYKRFFEKGIPPLTMILKTTYKDNRFLPQEYIDSLENMKETNPTYYQIYALGEFCSLDKLVFTNWQIENFDILELAGNGLEHRCGCDLGYIDATTIVPSLYDRENKTIYVYDEFYKSGCQLSYILEQFQQMQLMNVRVQFDAAEPRTIDYFKHNGVKAYPCVKGKDSVKMGIAFLQDNKIIIHPNCTHLITEFQNFAYKKDKSGEYIDGEYTHEWSHGIDGLRYGYSDIYTRTRLRTLNKDVLGL